MRVPRLLDLYNDNDRTACAWMRELMKQGHIPQGVVDERPIQEVKAEELRAYRRCHFFAGIAGWAYALELAGWPAGRPVWTGSCPCQPFSAAGKGKGEADERHLWPAWFSLIRECRPDCILGEQVGSRDGLRWLDGVRTDLEQEGYAVGAADLPACCAGTKVWGVVEDTDGRFVREGWIVVGAPHIRQRLFWVAKRLPNKRRRVRFEFDWRSATEINPDECDTIPLNDGRTLYVPKLGNTPDAGRAIIRNQRQSVAGAAERDQGKEDQRQRVRGDAGDGEPARLPPNPGEQRCDGREGIKGSGRQASERGEAGRDPGNHRKPGGFWDTFDVLDYRDGKRRRVEPGTFPLAHGVPARVGLLRGYGNAIVPQVAASFIRAFLEAEAVA